MATGTGIPLTPAEQAKLVKQLCRSPLFSLAGRYDLARLASSAKRFQIARGDTLCTLGRTPTALYVLLDGQYHIEGDARIDLGERGSPLIGLESVIGGTTLNVTVTALSDGHYIELNAAFARELYLSSPPLRFASGPMLRLPGQPDGRTDEDGGAAVVRFESKFPNTPLSFLIDLLGREIASAFPERVIIVKPASGKPSEPVKIPVDGPGELFRVEANPTWIQRNRGQYDYIFTDGIGDLGNAVNIIVQLVHAATQRDTAAPPVPWVLQTVVVQPASLPCSKTLTLINANREDLVTADACRLHLSFDALRRLEPQWTDDTKLTTLDPRVRASLGVWARALTLRRTGIALGGGGVWAMQGVYVLQELHRRGVPIDVVTGTSGGSLVGAYYSSLGLGGLDKLVELGDKGVLDAVVLGSFIAGHIMERFLACSLGNPCIEHLPYAEFYPASSGLAAGKGLVAVRGPLPLGVRAASSTPPLFGATITSGERLADGAYTNNLPVQALYYFNTALTLGVNSFPPSRMPVPPFIPECVNQFFASFGLLNRGLTFTTAFSLLGSISGEIESGFATVAYNARSKMIAPYLVVPDFFQSSQMVKAASEDPDVNAAIDGFANHWYAIAKRGRPPVSLHASGVDVAVHAT